MTLPWHKRRTENILRETIEAIHLQKVIIPLKRKSQYLLTRKNERKHHGSEFSWFVAVQLIQSVHPDSAYQRKTTLYHPINVSSWQSRTSFFDFMKQKGELPPGRAAASSTNTAFPFRDAEIEKELNELRQRAKDFWSFHNTLQIWLQFRIQAQNWTNFCLAYLLTL